MLQCKKCHSRLFESHAEKEHGDLIIVCSCGAKNILKVARINRLLVPTIEIAGWRD